LWTETVSLLRQGSEAAQQKAPTVMGNYRKTEKCMTNKTVYIILFSFFFNSCVFEYFPEPKTKCINYDYSQNHICYNYPISNEDFWVYSSKSHFKINSIMESDHRYNDSTSQLEIPINNNCSWLTCNIIFTGDTGSTCIKLKSFNEFCYLPGCLEDTSIFQKFTKQYCLTIFQKEYIKQIEDLIRDRIKIDTLYDNGLEQIENKEYSKAFANFHYIASTVLVKTQKLQYLRYSALNRMAYIKIQQGQYQEAIKILDTAMLIIPWEIRYEDRKDWEEQRDKLPESAKRYWVRKSYIDVLKSEYRYNSVNTEQLLIQVNYALAYIKTKQLAKAEYKLQRAEYLYPTEPYFKAVKDLYNNEKKK
jgi:tetratricopeptide (TPR) repeat protein